MRIPYQRRDSYVATLTMALLVAIVGIAFAQTSPASASGFSGVPTESYAWLVSGGEGAAAPMARHVASGPISAQSSEDDIKALQTSLTLTGAALPITGTYDDATLHAVKIFQAKQKLPRTGQADETTVSRLAIADRDGVIDPRCMGPGITLCIDKVQKVVRYVKDGTVIRTIDVNIGPEKGDKAFGQYSSTRVGVNTIFRKEKNAVSSLYGDVMRDFMQFDGGIGFHYSPFFEKTGYTNTSMGCVTIGNEADAAWLFDNTPMNTQVVVYA